MSAKARRDWRRRRVMDERSKTRASRARNLVKANQMVRDKSGLPKSMQEEVCRLYKLVPSRIRNRSLYRWSYSRLYILVARKEGVLDKSQRFVKHSRSMKKNCSRMIRHISRKFNMHKISCPSDYFGRFISDLKLPPKTSLEVDALWEQ